MPSKCPACHAPMLGDSPFCYACCREWSVLAYYEAPQPESTPAPLRTKLRRSKEYYGMGSRKLTLRQRETIREQLAEGRYGVQSRLARDHYVGVATINRIAKEMRAEA